MTRHLATLRDQIPLVRTSSKSVVKRTPDARKQPRPSTPRSKLDPSCLVPRLPAKARCTQPLEPILFPKGCSPWRPAAVMSTTRCESYSFPWIFKGYQERTGPDRGVGLYPPSTPSSGQSDFRGLSGQGEKRTLPGALASVSKFICVAAKDPHPGSGILTGFPFDRRHEKPFSLEYLLLPPRSALEAVSPSIAAKASSRTSTPAYSSMHHFSMDGEVWVARLSAIHFQG
ncbi:hypothetical protein H4582DRAFT_2214281 [Lactarius indigo]|nr:hypothetical protein H4582DRAFT_2214281 [Lactarius indigo]